MGPAFLIALSVLGQSIGPKRICRYDGKKVDALAMSSSRGFTLDLENSGGGYDVLTMWIELTDANTSITRFDTTCTVSHDGNTSDYTPQECTVASGICTADDSAIWRKSSPGTKKWPHRMDISGFPDIQCTFSVGAGAGAAADLLTVYTSMCTD